MESESAVAQEMKSWISLKGSSFFMAVERERGGVGSGG